MDAVEIEESLLASSDAKLHAKMCRKLSASVSRVMEIFPVLEAARPRSKSGIQALCSVHVALEKAKSLLQHCSNCSKLYLAITGDSILVKFEKARCALMESLKRVEDIVPQSIGCQIMQIIVELEGTVFTLDDSEKQIGAEIIALLQKEKKFSSNSNDSTELEVFHKAALQLGITSSRAALTERRALKKLVEKARAVGDKRKESIVAYLLHLMRKYSKLFRTDVADDTDSQGSDPCSPTLQGNFEDVCTHGCKGVQLFDRQLSRLSSFNFKQGVMRSGNIPTPPEELRCPISLQLMHDPVIIPSGQTYERICIEKWFNDGHSTCPKTQQKLPHLSLTPNYCVKGLIASWCEQNGIPIPDGPPESLDLNYWRLALSDHDAADSQSIGSIDSCNMKSCKVIPVEDSGVAEELKENDKMNNMENSFCQDSVVDEFQKCRSLLAVLCDSTYTRRQSEVVEQIRFLLKDDDEARIFMGANGFVEALIQFLRSAINEGDTEAQTVGAMALFNLAVNNNRNKGVMLSFGILSLLEEMILGSETQEPATALYLNLSCLDEAKPIISSSPGTPFLVELLSNSACSSTCKQDALFALYNLSTHPPNIPSLLEAGIIDGLHSFIIASGGSSSCSWAEKALPILINLSSSSIGKKDIIAAPGLIGGIATVLDIGESTDQEQAVSCLLILCEGDEKCCHMVLQEGVIPALVSLAANGTVRGKEKAQKLLRLFREQRQQLEPSPVQQRQQFEEISEVVVVVEAESKLLPLPKSRSRRLESSAAVAAEAELKGFPKSRSRRLGRAFASMCKNKSYQIGC